MVPIKTNIFLQAFMNMDAQELADLWINEFEKELKTLGSNLDL